jgi:peptidoglycan/LPS O-acetylase OafA/YrhL
MVNGRVPEGSDRHTTPVSGAITPKGFRLDIQGVRGFALVLVLACHAGIPWAEGGFVGLDVFYVLSGYLITGLILTEVDRRGGVSLLGFYARRARRLLPLAVTVLAFIVVVSAILFSPARNDSVSGDVIAAALYFVNWRFVAEAVDYFAFESPTVSPVQHYWSLSVEEQFYLLWPLVVVVVLAVARRAGLGHRGLLIALIGVLTAASLVYGVWFSEFAAQQAYFSTLARGWELGLGCVLALVLPAGLRMPRALAAAMSAGGVAVLAWLTVTLSDDVAYPGWIALAPTVATVAIIVAGTATVATLPIRVLSQPPLQYLGRISYAWYLWHWPLLVFAAALVGSLSIRASIVVTLIAWVPTIISHHLIEERFRRSRALAARPRRALRIGVTCTATAVALGVVLGIAQPQIPVASGAEAIGADAIERGDRTQRVARAIRPDLRHANDDRGPSFADGCHIKNDARVRSPRCAYGHLRSPTHVVLMGDSHALQYAPGMIALAKHRGWRLESLTMAGCTVATVHLRKRVGDQCDRWRENTLRRIERTRPAMVVVTTGTVDRYAVTDANGRGLDRTASEPLLEAGMRRTLRRLRATGAKVVVLRDQGKVPFEPVDCVSQHRNSLDECAFRPRRPASQAFDARAARRVEGVRLIDPLPYLCRQDRHRCPAVIGNVLVHRNTYHVSATFSRTLRPWLGRVLPRLSR